MTSNRTADETTVLLVPRWLDGERLPDPVNLPPPVSPEGLCTRRHVLRAGGLAGAAILTGFPSRKPQPAQAFDPFVVALSAAIGWLVTKVLDYHFGDWFKANAQLQPRAPAPTGGHIAFHDGWGNPYVVAKATLPLTFSPASESYLSVDKYPRVMPTKPDPDRDYLKSYGHYDYNKREMETFMAIDAKKALKSVPYPWGIREELDASDVARENAMMRVAMRENYRDKDPSEWCVEYRRVFNSASYKKPKIWYGVAKKRIRSEKSLIVLEE